MSVAIFRTCRSALFVVLALPSIGWSQPYFAADPGYASADFSLGGFNFNERGAVLGAGARWYFSEPCSISVQTSRFDDNLYRFAVGVGWGLQRPSG